MAVSNGDNPLQINLKPVQDIVLILEDEMSWHDISKPVQEALEQGTLFVPDEYKAAVEKVADSGSILACGEKVREKLAPGTRVRYGKFSGQRFTYKGYKLIRVREADLHAIETKVPYITVTFNA